MSHSVSTVSTQYILKLVFVYFRPAILKRARFTECCPLANINLTRATAEIENQPVLIETRDNENTEFRMRALYI